MTKDSQKKLKYNTYLNVLWDLGHASRMLFRFPVCGLIQELVGLEGFTYYSS